MWNNEKTIKVLKGAGLAAIGAGLTYLAAYFGQLDMGAYGPAVAAVLAVLANAIRQAMSDVTPPTTTPGN